jgi:excisionase family DNA binding protein
VKDARRFLGGNGMNEYDGLGVVLTVPEAAGILRVSANTLYRSVARGEVRSIRIGRRLLIPRVQLEKLLGLDLSGGDELDEDAAAARFDARRKLWARKS